MAVNYHNPTVEDTCTTHMWNKHGPGAFVQNAGEYNTRQGYVRIAITTYAHFNFILLFDFNVNMNYDTGDFYGLKPEKRDKWWLKEGNNGTGTLTASADNQFTATIDHIHILSTVPRYFRFADNVIIHPSNFNANSTIELVPGIWMYDYVLPVTTLQLGTMFFLTPSEGVFEDNPQESAYSIAEYPVYKDNNNNYYKRTSTAVVGTPMKARHSFFLYTIDNNTNTVFHQRDFNQFDENASSPALNKSKIGAVTTNIDDPAVGAFQTKGHNNKILTGRGIAVDLSANYPYYSQSFKSGSQYYPNLYMNNDGPTLQNPIVIYNELYNTNGKHLTREAQNLTDATWHNYRYVDLNDHLFFIDQYTLIFSNEGQSTYYYILPNGKVGISCVFGSGGNDRGQGAYDSICNAGTPGSDEYHAMAYTSGSPTRKGYYDEANLSCSKDNYIGTRDGRIETNNDNVPGTYSTGHLFNIKVNFPTDKAVGVYTYYTAGAKYSQSQSYYLGNLAYNSRSQQNGQFKYALYYPTFLNISAPTSIEDSFQELQLKINDYSEDSGSITSDNGYVTIFYSYHGGHESSVSTALVFNQPVLNLTGTRSDQSILLQENSASHEATAGNHGSAESSIKIWMDSTPSLGYCIYLYK